MAEREQGFYWVRGCGSDYTKRDEWIVALWRPGEGPWRRGWFIPGWEIDVEEEAFSEIGERVERHVTLPFKGEPIHINPHGREDALKPRMGRVIRVGAVDPLPEPDVGSQKP